MFAIWQFWLTVNLYTQFQWLRNKSQKAILFKPIYCVGSYKIFDLSNFILCSHLLRCSKDAIMQKLPLSSMNGSYKSVEDSGTKFYLNQLNIQYYNYITVCLVSGLFALQIVFTKICNFQDSLWALISQSSLLCFEIIASCHSLLILSSSFLMKLMSTKIVVGAFCTLSELLHTMLRPIIFLFKVLQPSQ